MTKLCYILPEYNEKIADHFYHQYELLKELSDKLDIFLIIEKGSKKCGLAMSTTYVQRFKFLPLRFLESFLVVLWARILGYKNFYTHYCYIGGINAGIISRLFGGKSYYWHCEMIWEFKQSLFSKIGLNLCFKLSHFLVTGSKLLKKDYAKNYGLKLNNIKVIPNWVNLERFKNHESRIMNHRKRKTILFVHWLSKRKGAHLIVPIIRQLISKLRVTDYELQVTIIGNGPLKEKIQKEIKENRLEKFVKILGRVPNKDLTEYYAKADIFIMPSLQEGFPRVILEAMAVGIPYVASDVGAVREMSPDIAQDFIVKRGNINEFAKKIQTLILDKEIYEKFNKEELNKIKEYSLKNVVNKFSGLFV